MNRLSLSFALVCFFAAACGGSETQAPTTATPASNAAVATDDTALRPAAEILDAAIEAGGGRDAALAIKTLHTVGTLSVAKAGVQGRLESWQKAPNLAHIEIDLPNLGKTIVKSDGTNVWESSSITGDRLLTEPELSERLRDFDLHAELEWRRYYPTVETLRKDEVDGEAAWVVRLVPTEGNEVLRWYSIERGLLLASETTASSPMGEIKVKTTLGDWRETDGSLVPYRSTQSMMGSEIVSTIESYETNVDIPDDRFEPTPAMKKLLEASEAPAEAAAPAAKGS